MQMGRMFDLKGDVYVRAVAHSAGRNVSHMGLAISDGPNVFLIQAQVSGGQLQSATGHRQDQ